MKQLPFNQPYVVGREFAAIAEAISNGHLSGDGPFSRRCHEWIEAQLGCLKALLTHSCTAALEMAAILADIEPGDEVILPSYTFVSTANAFVLRGAVPVFVDIRPDTLNLDERLVEAAITKRTRAIVPVHYAGVGCEMDVICSLAEAYRLLVIEDAAQGLMASYKGRALGTFGQLAAVSFHETKNVICGEGGALLVNDARWSERAEIIRDKGTNRKQFYRGQVDKYTWVDIGSSFLPSEINAAFLYTQFGEAEPITAARLAIWDRYHELLTDLEARELLRRPTIPGHCTHNAHMYYVLVRSLAERKRVLDGLREAGVSAVFHYVPLHSAPAGRRYGRTHGSMAVTDAISDQLIRLPLWVGMTPDDQERVVSILSQALLG